MNWGGGLPNEQRCLSAGESLSKNWHWITILLIFDLRLCLPPPTLFPCHSYMFCFMSNLTENKTKKPSALFRRFLARQMWDRLRWWDVNKFEWKRSALLYTCLYMLQQFGSFVCWLLLVLPNRSWPPVWECWLSSCAVATVQCRSVGRSW